jgi:hypothetical protein
MPRVATLLAVLLLAAACGPLPQPFAHDGPDSGVAGPRDLAPLAIAPVDGVPGLAEALVPALAAQDVVASTAPGGSALVLSAQLLGPHGNRFLLWRLRTAAGQPAGQTTQPVPDLPGDRQALSRLAAGSADVIARLLRGEDQPKAAPVRPPSVTLRPVEVSGRFDGAGLGRAMAGALSRRGLTVASGSDKTAFQVAGRLIITRAADGNDMVDVEWIVIAPSGKELGRVSQGSPVAHELLLGDTTPLARQIAEAGAEGIGEVIRKSRNAL